MCDLLYLFTLLPRKPIASVHCFGFLTAVNVSPSSEVVHSLVAVFIQLVVGSKAHIAQLIALKMQRKHSIALAGAIEYYMLTKEYLEGALDVMRKSFFMFETVSVAVELPLNPLAIAELDQLVLRTIRDGVSIVAIDKITRNVVGAALNKINVLTPEDEAYLPNYRDSCKTPEAKALLQFMIDIDHECNLFDMLKIDCVIEIMFLATMPDYLGKGIAKKLNQLSVDITRKLYDGENIKESVITIDSLPLGPRPLAVSAYYTSFVTQKIGEKQGFKRGASPSFDKWSYNGKLFSETIGPETPNATIDYFLF